MARAEAVGPGAIAHAQVAGRYVDDEAAVGRRAAGSPDWALIATILTLTLIGLIFVFSSSFAIGQQLYGDPHYFATRQLQGAGLGAIAFLFFARLDYRRLRAFSPLIMIVGVVGLMTPWNLPLYLLSWKVAPAIATGNTAVAKPSEITPVTAHRLAQICMEAGLPPGVLNIVHGTGAKAGASLVEHPDVNTISFTGGTATGEVIARAAAPMFKKIALELGGKNPNIIFADADFDEVIPASLRSSFANQGQVCLCGSRVFVEQQRYDEFVDRFVTATRKIEIGDPLEESTDHGAQVSQAQLDKVRYYVELAKDEGGEILCGGRQPEAVSERCKNGYFFEPTVITGLGVECRVNQEEIFGPVVTIMPFESEDQVADYANSTKYGLSASIWTQNLTRAHRLAERIDSGTVWVNCWMLRDLRVPFGGMKSSGVGREGGAEAMRFFTEPKNVCIKI